MPLSTKRDRLVIVGNGMASVRLCEELVALGSHQRFAITVIGAEPVAGYNRVLLSAHLAGEASREDIQLKDAEWYRAHGIDLRLGRKVESIDREARELALGDGTHLHYDKLVLATGSEPIRLSVPGSNLAGVHVFRDLTDTQALANLGPAPRRIAVIGGGLLGIEAAYGLQRAGHHVTLVHLMDRLMERQLDQRAAAHLCRAIEKKGITVHLKAATSAIIGDEQVTGIAFADGSTIASDAVVFSAGIRPSVALAKAAGLTINRGVVVDDRMMAAKGIYALGECAEHNGIVYGLVEPAYSQAKVLAYVLSGVAASYAGSVLATNLKVSGVGVFSIGHFEGAEGTTTATLEDKTTGHYRKLVFRGDRLVGAVLVGATGDALWYRDLVMRGELLGTLRQSLIFGKAACMPQQENDLQKAA
jgi:nitrite reductase (NADH) large subunit